MPNRTLLASLVASLPLSLLAVPAAASDPLGDQSSESSSVSRIVDGDFDLTVKTVRKTRTLDDGSIETTESSEMKAMRDGKEIPQERLRRTGNRVEILDEKGEVIHSAVVAIGPAGATSMSRTYTSAAPVAAPTARPMLGVTLEETGEPLVKHLRLEPGRSTLLTSIMPDSPAATAGLETFDVVTAIGDRDDASPDAIREFLAAAKVGDEVRLAIVRAGEKREVKVTLAAMSDAMSARNAAGEPLDPEIRAMLEELRARGIDIDLGGVFGGNQGVIVAPGPNAGGGMRFIVPPSGGFAMPGGGPDFAEFEERMRRMQEELERAMQRLDRMRPVAPAPPAPAPAPPPSGREA